MAEFAQAGLPVRAFDVVPLALDRRDVAGASPAAMRAPELKFATRFVPGRPGASAHIEVGSVRRELRWTPRHDFGRRPSDAP